MSLLDKLTSLISPHNCLGCGSEGELLCKTCLDLLNTVPSRCYRCRKLTKSYKTCQSCRSSSPLHSVYVQTDYDYIAKELIWRFKYTGARAAALTIASSLKLPEPYNENLILVPVPTATSRARQRGYDQAKLIARNIAKLSRVPYVDCLSRINQAHQVGASRYQRRIQLKNAFRIKKLHSVEGVTVILIDDVVTTGATLEAAATVVKQAGAKQIRATIFAQP